MKGKNTRVAPCDGNEPNREVTGSNAPSRLAQAEAPCSRDRRHRAFVHVPATVVSVVRGVLGMEITLKRIVRLKAVAAPLLLGIAGLALMTFVCFWLGLGVARTAFAYLILVTLVSLLGSFRASVVLSIVATACLSYFFAMPLFALRVDSLDDIERIAAFLTTSLVVTALTTKLRASEGRFRTFVDHATDAFLLLDDHWTVLDVNRQACDSLGYSREELIGKHKSDLDVGLDEASIQRLKQRMVAGEAITFETRHRRKDGTPFPVEVRVGQFEQGGRRFLCLVRDITERKRAEEVLRDSEAKLQKAQRIAHFGWWERDFSTNHVSLSDEVCRIFGLQPVELPEWHARWLELIHPEDRPRAAEAAATALLPGGQRYDVEYRVVRPDGAERIVHSQGDVTWDESGRPLRQFGVLQDITELRQAEKELRASEEALRRSEAYLAEAQRLSHTGTLAFNATAPVYWSQESYRIWGLDPLQGLPNRETVLQRIHPDDRERVNVETEEALRQKRDFAIEFRIVLPDGTGKYVESTGHPLFSADGELVEMIATHVDVTERKRAQKEQERLRELEADLAHVNRMSMMGELAASLAHEILHPIATARNNARAGMRFLEMSPPNLGEVKEALACVVRDADRAKDIVGRIRDHIKKAPPRRELFDLNEAINEVIVMVRSTIVNTRVSVRTRLMEVLPVLGDRVQLQQVVMNLVLNAVEAMSSVAESVRELSIETEQSETGGILVAVRDSGPGIDSGHLERVFEPFYTTKTSGVGMGLSICRSIIDAHGGRLWVGANHPQGAVFQFTLPAAHEDS
jgi:PAS domain S-box-containing protein